jgi:hypothetical protein
MRTLSKIPVELVECHFIPEQMEFGKLYYSREYNTTNHLCLCGCGSQVPLPIKECEWSLVVDNGRVTISPSIQQRFDCFAHYIITNGVGNIVNQPVPKSMWGRTGYEDSQPGE